MTRMCARLASDRSIVGRHVAQRGLDPAHSPDTRLFSPATFMYIQEATAAHLVTHDGWSYHKVPTASTLDGDIMKTCAAAGMVTPCAGLSGCSKNNEAHCTITSEAGCTSPMATSFAATGCTSGDLGSCSLFQGVYAYMGETWAGAACGIVGAHYCATGASDVSGYAFCATDQIVYHQGSSMFS